MNDDIISAHKFCTNNKIGLLSDNLCGCFYCLTIFEPTKINFWLEPENTAICPYCGIDAVIGVYSGYPITSEFLKKMRNYWF